LSATSLALYTRDLGLDSAIKHYGGMGAMVIHGAVGAINLVQHGGRGREKRGFQGLKNLAPPN